MWRARFPAWRRWPIYQWWAFGLPYLPSQHYMPPTAPTARGYRGFDWPSPALMWANFFDPQFGLFAYCPALLAAFAAPFVRRVPYRAPRRETAILYFYFALFVLFCAANQYSWLQPLTGFRYLVPVVPALALLTAQAAEAIPAAVRRVLFGLAIAESVVVSAAHVNDLRLTAATLWQRRFALLWMIRLREAGMPAPWVASLALLAAVALLAVWLRLAGRLRAETTL